MIYADIDREAEGRLCAPRVELNEVSEKMQDLTTAIRSEDSKVREAEMKDEFKVLQKRLREVRTTIDRIKNEVFRQLLAAEYDLPLTHPKFEAVFSLAWQHGSGHGYSDIENYFSEYAELVREDNATAKVLNFVADRLVHVHGENPNVDYVLSLRRIAGSN